MNAHALTARIESVGFWSKGLPSWDAARVFAANGTLSENAPAKPSPQLLPPNERRRAPESVAVALEVALAACQTAGRDPAKLSSVFASTHGDLSITDYMCATLASDPRAISPTKFHNSVHNAAAGYWTIGAGCMQAASAISAYDASFAEGLIDALAQLAEGADAVLLVGYDTGSMGPLLSVHACDGLLGGALVLARADAPQAQESAMSVRLRAWLDDGEADANGALSRHSGSNAIGPMLPLFDALAARETHTALKAGPGRVLRVELVHE